MPFEINKPAQTKYIVVLDADGNPSNIIENTPDLVTTVGSPVMITANTKGQIISAVFQQYREPSIDETGRIPAIRQAKAFSEIQSNPAVEVFGTL